MVLRFLVVEKHVAIKYIKAGLVDIPGFEARGYTSPGAVEPEKANSTEGEDSPSSSRALLTMITSMRPLTLYALVILNVGWRETFALQSARLTDSLAGNGHRRACR